MCDLVGRIRCRAGGVGEVLGWEEVVECLGLAGTMGGLGCSR